MAEKIARKPLGRFIILAVVLLMMMGTLLTTLYGLTIKNRSKMQKIWKIMKKSANIVNTAAMPAAALEKAGDRGYNVYGGFF